MKITNRRLLPEDAEAYVELRSLMLQQEPWTFLASPEDDFASKASDVRASLDHAESAIFGAFAGEELVGTVGVFRAKMLKARHKIGVWGMFVLPAHRRTGIGRTLLRRAISHARGLSGATRLGLSVAATAEPALALYQSLGFEVWGTEPEAVCHQGRSVAEHHLSLPLGNDS